MTTSSQKGIVPADEHAAAMKAHLDRLYPTPRLYPPREITEDGQFVKFFTTSDTVKTMAAVAQNLGLSLNQVGRLFFEIGLAMAPTLMAMQTHHTDTMARAIIEAKREHGQKVRRAAAKAKKPAAKRR